MTRLSAPFKLRGTALAAALLLAALLLQGCAGKGELRQEDSTQNSRAAEEIKINCAKVFCGAVAAEERSDPFADDPFNDGTAAEATAPDPFETFNRGMFWLNDKLYFYLIKPTVRAYRFIIPKPVRNVAGNFFINLSTPISFANDLLQLDGNDALKDLTRFTLNSTVGILGAFDVAKTMGGLPARSEDMGQTLGHYGLGHGFYLVVPLIGPTSARDGIGTVADLAFYPLTYLEYGPYDRIAIKTVEEVNDYSLDKDLYEAMVRQSLDPYLTIRNGYLQMRAGQLEK